MPPTAIASPFTWSQLKTDLGLAAVFAHGIALDLAEDLNPLVQAGALAVLEGNLAGSDSDTMRLRDVGGLTFDAGMTAVGETGAVAPSAMSSNYVDVAIAIYALGREMSYLATCLASDPMLDFRTIMSMVQASAVRQIRDLWCDTGALFAATLGGTGTAWTVDNHLALVAVFRANAASYRLGRPLLVHASKLIEDLIASARLETALIYGGPTTFGSVQGLSQSATRPDFLGLGIDMIQTDSVNDDATDYQNFAYLPGAIATTFLDVTAMQTANPTGTMKIPGYGLIVEELLDGANARVLGFNAAMHLGMVERSIRTHGPRRRCLSVM